MEDHDAGQGFSGVGAGAREGGVVDGGDDVGGVVADFGGCAPVLIGAGK